MHDLYLDWWTRGLALEVGSDRVGRIRSFLLAGQQHAVQYTKQICNFFKFSKMKTWKNWPEKGLLNVMISQFFGKHKNCASKSGRISTGMVLNSYHNEHEQCNIKIVWFTTSMVKINILILKFFIFLQAVIFNPLTAFALKWTDMARQKEKEGGGEGRRCWTWNPNFSLKRLGGWKRGSLENRFVHTCGI